MAKMDIMSLNMTGSRVLVRQDKLTDKTTSGIIIQNRNKEESNKGIVLKVGPGSQLENGTVIPVCVKPKDTVIYSTFAGAPLKVEEDDNDYIILNERDILCYIES